MAGSTQAIVAQSSFAGIFGQRLRRHTKVSKKKNKWGGGGSLRVLVDHLFICRTTLTVKVTENTLFKRRSRSCSVQNGDEDE